MPVPLPVSTSDVSSQFALDANALDKLKLQAKSDPKQALSAAAGQFEALFMQMVLKSMREALPQDGPLSSETSKTYTSMLDQQIAQQLSKKGIGVASVLTKQLANTLPKTDAPGDASSTPTTLDKAKSALAVHAATSMSIGARASAKDASATNAGSETKSLAGAALGSVAETIQSFAEKLRPYAEAIAQKLGVPAHYLIAQAGLETGWGKSQPRSADGTPSHNLFGIKATNGWKGPATTATTTEYAAGQAEKTTAAFRSYSSYGDALQDFANLLQGSRRYANALANTHDASKYATSLQQAGYATDPRYAEKLTKAIQLVSRYAPAATPTQVAAAPADNRSDLA
jgi:flagellar protein FlgJ